MNFLITAGPTREYIDPVRFISNASSGRQGVAIAEEAAKNGHAVVLIMGPCPAIPAKNINVINITSAEEMFKNILYYRNWADVLIMTAAVCDWRASSKSGKKIKKTKKTIAIKLKQNPDILAAIGKLKREGKTKPDLTMVGFSVDTGNIIEDAINKLKRKSLDLIIANPVVSINSEFTKSIMIDKSGEVVKLPHMRKNELAKRLISLIYRKKIGQSFNKNPN